MEKIKEYADFALEILQQMIVIPSFSKEEKTVADLMENILHKKKYPTHRKGNNVWVFSKNYSPDLPTILLNSHLDTVCPNAWTKDPFTAEIEEGKLYGLGSNDAGGCLVSLLTTFLALEEKKQPYNLVFAASAEEEISGRDGFELIQDEIGKIDIAIVGEPTLMQMAVAEKGLMVIDGEARGKSGHAAREEGINAISIALDDIYKLNHFQFDKKSELLGEVKISVTQIEAGSQHNVVPASCQFVIDIRSNEHYSNQEIFECLSQQVQSKLTARSFRMNSSGIDLKHPLVKKGIQMGMNYYGSPTTSDQAIMKGFPTLKLGPGDSARSHTSDEYIYVKEIADGIEKYYNLLDGLQFEQNT